MFDIGFSELVLVAIVALLVLGPEKLPHTIRMVAAYTGRIKRAVNQLKYELESEVEAQERKLRLQKENNTISQLTPPRESETPLPAPSSTAVSSSSESKNSAATQSETLS